MAGNQTPCLDCGAPPVEWGEGRCIACDLRMTLLKDCDRLLELSSASTLLRDHLGKPHRTPTRRARTNEDRPNADQSRGGYVEEVRKLYGGRLPWEADADA